MTDGTDEPTPASEPDHEPVPELGGSGAPDGVSDENTASADDVGEDQTVGEPAADTPGSASRRRDSRRSPGDRTADGAPTKKAKKKHRKAPWWELPALVIAAVVVAILVKTFLVQPFFIPSESMEKTLHGCSGCHGDRILVNKTIYDFRDPHPGDIVVFHAPAGWDDEPATEPPSNPILKGLRGFGQLVGFVPPDGEVLVKRVIAMGGQTVRGVDGKVQVSDDGGKTYRTLDEPYVYLDGPDTHGTFGPVTVPKDRLWVMGDHRNDSADSRFHCQSSGGDCANTTSATVPVSDVIGKAFVIAWPPSRWRTLGTPATFKQHAEAEAAALSGGVPVLASLTVMVPVGLLRRRRRRSEP